MVFIEKNRARRGFVFVEIVRQIVAVVSIDHRQVEHIVNRYPRHKVVVLRVQRLHLRQRLAAHRVIHGGFDRVLRGRGGRLRCRSLRRVLRLDRRRFGRLCRFSRLRIFGLHLRAVQGGKPGESFSLAGLDAPNVVLETIKRAEDGDGAIVRMYECENSLTNVTLDWNLPFHAAESCNCLEQPDGEPVEVKDGKITFTVKPYEIKTIRIR